MSQSSSQAAVQIWDPAAPAATLASHAASATQLLFAIAHSDDAAHGTRTELGAAQAFFLQDGHVMRLDLRRGQTHVPQPLSTLADACGLDAVYELDALGSEAWVALRRPGADGWCSQAVLVRSSMDSSTAPLSLAGVRLLGLLADDSGTTQALLAAGPASSGAGEWLRVYDRDLNALGLVTDPDTDGSSDQAAALLAYAPGQAGLAYVAVGGQVRRLRWSGSSARLEAGSLHPLQAAPQTAAGPGELAIAHAQGLYLADGQQILNLHDGQSELLAALSQDELVSQLRLTDTHLVLRSDISYVSHLVSAVPLAGGSRVTLASSAMQQLVGLLGVSADWVVYYGANSLGRVVHRVHPDGSADSVISQGVVGLVLPVSQGLHAAPQVQSLLVCPQAEGPGGSCASGELAELDLGSLATQSLGRLAMTVNSLSLTAYQGLPLGFTASAAASSALDAMALRPGQAGSLQRLTHYLP